MMPSSRTSRQTTQQSYARRLDRVLRTIQQSLDQPLSVEVLAEVAHFSPYHFHRLFTALTGETLLQYIRRLRLERAAWQLRYSRRTVTSVALECGFEAPEAFSRAFRARFGVPPSRWQRDSSVYQAHLPSLTGSPPMHAAVPPPLPTGIDPATLTVALHPVTPVACLRHTGPYMAIGPVFERLFALSAEKGLLGPSTRTIQISYDDPRQTDGDKLRADACITLPTPAPPPEALAPLSRMDIPEGHYASLLYTGPYEGLDAVYSWLYGAWLPSSGYECDDRPCLEIYLNAPATTAPNLLQTMVQLPVSSAVRRR